ncbi:hypothetical protein [Streptomyces acidicola]
MSRHQARSALEATVAPCSGHTPHGTTHCPGLVLQGLGVERGCAA